MYHKRGNDEFIPSEQPYPPNKKQKLSANDTPAPLDKKEKIKWTPEDNEKIRTSLIRNGNDYTRIKAQFFASRTEITPRAISNHINGDEDLKSIQQANLIKSRESKIQQFRENNSNNERSIVIRDYDSEEDEADDKEERQSEYEKIVDTPTLLPNGQYLVPNIQYLRESALFKGNKKEYYFVMRLVYSLSLLYV